MGNGFKLYFVRKTINKSCKNNGEHTNNYQLTTINNFSIINKQLFSFCIDLIILYFCSRNF
jgi:hypothetical protein